jgi:nucleoside-diphosphate-sugar epimerase
MRVLLTGAFGNIGISALEKLTAQGHIITCFDVKTKANRLTALRFHGRAEVIWGDLRRPEDIAAAVADQDVVVHLAFVIPKLSATGINCEDRPDWAWEINVGGTRNLIQAMKAQPRPPRIIFASTMHLYGNTQHQRPPRKVSDPVHGKDHYTRHKIECERMIRQSGLRWAILRLAAVMPLTLRPDPGMFDVPLDNRMEFVHTRDVGLALANAVVCDKVWGKTLHIGGGPRCQFYFREMAAQILETMGIGMLPEDAFTKESFATDWLDTAESQRILQYQRYDFGDYVQEMSALMGYRRHLVRLVRPLARRWVLNKSPYLRPQKHARLADLSMKKQREAKVNT